MRHGHGSKKPIRRIIFSPAAPSLSIVCPTGPFRRVLIIDISLHPLVECGLYARNHYRSLEGKVNIL